MIPEKVWQRFSYLPNLLNPISVNTQHVYIPHLTLLSLFSTLVLYISLL